MNIVKKEILEFSEAERKAISLVCDMSVSLMREANNPNLKKLAEEIYYKVSELWGYEK